MVQISEFMYAAAAVIVAIGSMWCFWNLDIDSIPDYMESGLSWVKGNQMLQTFIFGSISTSVLFTLQMCANVTMKSVYSWFRSEVTIDNTDPNYNAVLDYITAEFLSKKLGATSIMRVQTKVKKNKTWKDWRNEWNGIGKNKAPELEYRPNDNATLHEFSYKGHKFLFSITKGKTVTVGWERKPVTQETLRLSMWGTDRKLIMELLNEAILSAQSKDEGGIHIYVLSRWDGWEKAMTKRPRTIDSVILDLDDAESILDDARKFMTSGDWYASVGIPYRRGYLLYGPPGCGKTSFAQVLAGELKLDICILNLTHEGLNDNSLAEALRDAPSNALILLEDVDAIFVERNAAASVSGEPGGGMGRSAGVSFSGLLNALDGVAAQEGRILFMTTNHIEKLDSALIRPGRCDRKVEVRKASKLQMERMFLRFFPGHDSAAEMFARRVPADEISMAQLQGHFMEFIESAELALSNIPKLLNLTKPLMARRVNIYEHLRRVGLELYTAAFEFLGISFTFQIPEVLLSEGKSGAKNAVSSLMEVCPALRLDLAAAKRMTKLLAATANDAENDPFVRSQYSIAELSTIRDTFLAAFPTAYERAFGERSPVLRRQNSESKFSRQSSFPKSPQTASLQSSSHVFSQDVVMNTNNYMTSLGDELKASNDGIWMQKFAVQPDSVDINDLLDDFLLSFPPSHPEHYRRSDDVHPVLLDKLSRRLTEALSAGGKGAVSLYQLHTILALFPQRPVQCVAAVLQAIHTATLSKREKQGASCNGNNTSFQNTSIAVPTAEVPSISSVSRYQFTYSMPVATVEDVVKRAGAMEQLYDLEKLAGLPPPEVPAVAPAATTQSQSDTNSAVADDVASEQDTPSTSGTSSDPAIGEEAKDEEDQDEVEDPAQVQHVGLQTLIKAFTSSDSKVDKDASYAPMLLEVLKSETDASKPMTLNQTLFSLVSRPRAMHEFIAFYRAKEATAAAEVTHNNALLITVDAAVSGASQKQKKPPTFNVKHPEDPNLSNIAESPKPSWTHVQLEELAYKFSCLVTRGDALCTIGLVSVLQIQQYLARHPTDPFAAATEKTIAEGLLCSKKPTPPAPMRPTVEKEWVYKWLRGQDDPVCASLADNYGKSFVDQGMGELYDWVHGPILDHETLKTDLGVGSVGHRRRIIALQQALQLEEKNNAAALADDDTKQKNDPVKTAVTAIASISN